MEKLSQKSIKKGFNFKSFFKEWGLIFFILSDTQPGAALD